MSDRRYYLGLDASTQSLSAVVADSSSRRVVYEGSVQFDRDLPEYGTENGVLRHEGAGEVHAPPLMWVAALDRLLEAMRAGGVPMAEIAAVSGSGQQHGSVYLTGAFPTALKQLDPSRGLAEPLSGCLSRPTSPVWMDSSTGRECAEIREALGGMRAVAETTGSDTFERFTGPQIRKFWRTAPAAYERTDHIALVSSFLASVISGRVAPIDPGDGAGMNLMDIARFDWSPRALDATAPNLARRLPPIAAPDTVIGSVHPYFVDRYGLSPDAASVIWSGDNPSSVVGLGLVRPGMAAVSLGTSDTFFGTMADCRTDPRGEGHVFGSPAGGYMTLICFINGSLARERVRDELGLDWQGFADAMAQAPPGNGGRMLLPHFEPEIVPRVASPRVRRLGLDPHDAPGNCRAVVEAQMASMRIHSRWMQVSPDCIYATGGASRNRAILQVMADIHRCPVHVSEVSNGAALGAALRAMHAHQGAHGRPTPWEDVVAGFTDPVHTARVDPNPNTHAVYEDFVEAYERFEDESIAAD